MNLFENFLRYSDRFVIFFLSLPQLASREIFHYETFRINNRKIQREV
jgi:hypothetical protein